MSKFKSTWQKNKEKQEWEAQVKRKRNRRIKLALIFLVLFLVWAGKGILEQQQHIQEQQQALAEIKHRVDSALDQQQDLIYQARRLQDDDYIAELARKDYFYSHEGEVIFRIPEPNKEKSKQQENDAD